MPHIEKCCKRLIWERKEYTQRIRNQTLILLDKLNELDDDEGANACEKLHNDVEALHKLLAKKWSTEEKD